MIAITTSTTTSRSDMDHSFYYYSSEDEQKQDAELLSLPVMIQRGTQPEQAHPPLLLRSNDHGEEETTDDYFVMSQMIYDEDFGLSNALEDSKKAYNVFHSTNFSDLLRQMEPTPIGPKGIQKIISQHKRKQKHIKGNQLDHLSPIGNILLTSSSNQPSSQTDVLQEELVFDYSHQSPPFLPFRYPTNDQHPEWLMASTKHSSTKRLCSSSVMADSDNYDNDAACTTMTISKKSSILTDSDFVRRGWQIMTQGNAEQPGVSSWPESKQIGEGFNNDTTASSAHISHEPSSSVIVGTRGTTEYANKTAQTTTLPTMMKASSMIIDNLRRSSKKTVKIHSHHHNLWYERLQDLINFKKEHGHCQVPHQYPSNQKLAEWVKRQRYQYKLKRSKQHSTLTDKRHEILEELGFIWDSQDAAWFDRLESLIQFKSYHGHCNVPASYPLDPSLGIWVKYQRRQYKLLQKHWGDYNQTTLTKERIVALNKLGFNWNPRNL